MVQRSSYCPESADSGDSTDSTDSLLNSPNNSPGNKRSQPKLKLIFRLVLALCLAGLLSLGALIVAAITDKDMPKWDPQTLDNLNYSSHIYDKDGNKIAQLSSTENRLPFEYEDLPDLLKQTLIAVEDKRFYQHSGTDPLRIIKGIFNTLTSDKREGGSTITVQLAKNAFIQNKTSTGFQGLKRKIQEVILATQIERNYTKDQILTAYLAHIYFGHGAFGVRTASQVYFGKELADLTPPEIAMLCGIPQAPGSYDPYVNPDAAQYRRNVVLQVMRDASLITPHDYELYKETPFTWIEKINSGEVSISPTQGAKPEYPYFVDYVVRSLENQYGISQDQIYKGGLHIYTTVDPKIQAAAEKTMGDPRFFPKSTDAIEVQGALVMLENTTGNIVAIVGGRQYPENQQLCLNRASDSKRQPGSVAKPLIAYTPALELGGYFPGTIQDDAPTTYNNWSVRNYDSTYRGLITMREAVAQSVNVYAVKTYEQAGPAYCWNFARTKMGLGLQSSNSTSLSNALGTFEATPLEIARAFSAFPNKGILNETHCVTKILDSHDRVILEPQSTPTTAMKESTAYVMSDMLRSVVTGGTGTKAAIGNWYICGKTGTTSLDTEKFGNRTGNPDAWFAGYSPLYTCVVWMGYDKTDLNHYLIGEYGGNRPATIWKEVMREALENKPVQPRLPQPSEVVTVQYDIMSGLVPSDLTPPECIRTEIAPTQGTPTRTSDVWIELSVDPLDSDRLASNRSPGVPRSFLNMPNRPYWASKEVLYRPPEQYYELFNSPNIDYNDPVLSDSPNNSFSPDNSGSSVSDGVIPTPSYNTFYTRSSQAMSFQSPTLIPFNYSAIVYIQGPEGNSMRTPSNPNSFVIENISPGHKLWVSLSDGRSEGSKSGPYSP